MILAIVGPDKSTKTSTSLYAPKPMVIFEFDIGTVERGLRWKDHKNLKYATYPRTIPDPPSLETILKTGNDVYILRYPTPLGFGPATERDIKPIWNQFIKDFAVFLENKDIPTGSLDTATKCWWLCHTNHLQTLPPIDGRPRTSLQNIEYGPANNLMSSLLYGIRNYDIAAQEYGWPCKNKHLMLTHHITDVYGPTLTERGIVNQATGELKLDGFKHTGSLIDLEIWLEVKQVELNEEKKARPVGNIHLSAYSLDMVGQTIIEPTFDKIQKMIGRMTT